MVDNTHTQEDTHVADPIPTYVADPIPTYVADPTPTHEDYHTDTHEADTPEEDTHEAYTHEADTPEEDTHEADTPEEDTHEADTPEEDTPEKYTHAAEDAAHQAQVKAHRYAHVATTHADQLLLDEPVAAINYHEHEALGSDPITHSPYPLDPQ